MRPRVLRRRLILAGFGAILAGATIGFTAPEANAYPSCGMGIPSVSSPWGGFCDSPPIAPQGQHYHCQWGMGFELCEYRWADNTPAPFPGQVNGQVLR